MHRRHPVLAGADAQVKAWLGGQADVVMSDMAAASSGHKGTDHLRIVALDVTHEDSIRDAVAAAGPLDVLVNNAGIGLLNALEGTPMATVRDVFETNTLGTIAMTQAVLPQLRQRRSGVIVNVTSSVTLEPLPLLSVYRASKAAVNAFTESLALELESFNVQVRLVLPGRAPQTRFGENARPRMG